jgi:hypothetical protein
MRRQVLIMLVFVLSTVARVSAEEPRPADIEACNAEAVTAASTAVPSAAGPAGDTTGSTGSKEKTDDSAAASPMTKHGDSPSTAQERQAFAACLARHGYYKGYYH